jgi:hypothetical protein
MSGQQLDIWVIYYNTSDHPGVYALRRQWPQADGTVVCDPQGYTCPKIEPLQELLEHRGLVKLMRSPEDDPVIVETWI